MSFQHQETKSRIVRDSGQCIPQRTIELCKAKGRGEEHRKEVDPTDGRTWSGPALTTVSPRARLCTSLSLHSPIKTQDMGLGPSSSPKIFKTHEQAHISPSNLCPTLNYRYNLCIFASGPEVCIFTKEESVKGQKREFEGFSSIKSTACYVITLSQKMEQLI